MHDFLELLVSNTVVALALALVAVLATGLRARPALVHCLWVLVLVKLVTPPILPVPIDLPVASLRAEPSPFDPSVLSTLELSALAAQVPSPSPAPRLVDAPAEPFEVPWGEVVLGLWALGTALVALCTWRSTRRMRALIRYGRPAPRLQAQADRLARRMSLRAPRVHLVPGVLSPMLWAAGGRPALLIPQLLLPRLDRHEQATLLAHELAHLKRRDHWVRYLEVLVRGLYWWHPLVWWACRQLRIAEEECCDAWVLWALPKASRSYAEALLETVEFLSDSPAVLPVAASGVGRVQNLKRRLTMIMQAKTRRTLSGSGRVAVLGLAAFALPLLPVHGQGTGDLHIQNEQLHQQHLHLEQLKNQAHLLQLHAEHLQQQGDLHAVEEVKHQIADLHVQLQAGNEKVALLEHHLQLQDQDSHTKEVLAALHAAIGALRERDQDQEAAVLERLAESLMQGHQTPAVADQDRAVLELEKKLVEEADRRAVLLDEIRAVQLDKQDVEQAAADKARALKLLNERDVQEARDRTVELNRADKETLELGDAQTDQIRRLQEQVDHLTQMVQRLAEMAEKQAAGGGRVIR